MKQLLSQFMGQTNSSQTTKGSQKNALLSGKPLSEKQQKNVLSGTFGETLKQFLGMNSQAPEKLDPENVKAIGKTVIVTNKTGKNSQQMIIPFQSLDQHPAEAVTTENKQKESESLTDNFKGKSDPDVKNQQNPGVFNQLNKFPTGEQGSNNNSDNKINEVSGNSDVQSQTIQSEADIKTQHTVYPADNAILNTNTDLELSPGDSKKGTVQGKKIQVTLPGNMAETGKRALSKPSNQETVITSSKSTGDKVVNELSDQKPKMEGDTVKRMKSMQQGNIVQRINEQQFKTQVDPGKTGGNTERKQSQNSYQLETLSNNPKKSFEELKKAKGKTYEAEQIFQDNGRGEKNADSSARKTITVDTGRINRQNVKQSISYSGLQSKNQIDFQDSRQFQIDNIEWLKEGDAKGGEFSFDLDSGTEQAGNEGKWARELKLNAASTQITTHGGRREMSIQVAQKIQQSLNQTFIKKTEQWQNHRFVFDDGNSLNVSVRQAEGGLQLQLATGNSELNKLIQQHLSDIQRHLQEQMNMDIDLGMQNFGGKNPQTVTEEKNKDESPNVGSGTSNEFGDKAGNGTESHRIRYMGFNENEWTA